MPNEIEDKEDHPMDEKECAALAKRIAKHKAPGIHPKPRVEGVEAIMASIEAFSEEQRRSIRDHLRLEAFRIIARQAFADLRWDPRPN